MRVPGVCRKRRFFRTLKQTRRRLTGSPMSNSSFHIRVWMVAFLLILCLAFSAAALGGENFPLVGDWAFNHAPEKTVLLVRDDGTAVYDGRDWTWEGDETFLNLQNTEGETFSIRYAADEDGIRIYLPGDYTRRDKLVDEEIWGAWIKDTSDASSFIFEKDGRFMEDTTFVGTYKVDPEAGTFLLQYQPAGYFNDTLCYFEREGDHMTVFYPWPLTAVQANP